jgi:hypothetical protein
MRGAQLGNDNDVVNRSLRIVGTAEGSRRIEAAFVLTPTAASRREHHVSHQRPSSKAVALAVALETWAAARQRAVAALTTAATSLEHSGALTEAARLRSAAYHLTTCMLDDRNRAAKLLNEGSLFTQDLDVAA